MTLTQFDFAEQQGVPLATRMRPQLLSEVIGQQHLLAAGKPLHQVVLQQRLHSMILWGPPGTGKTTLAKILATSVTAHFASISAVLAGVKEIREVVQQAKILQQQGKRTVLFVDEVHRFNKAQQDAFLPHIESGDILFIGATTENPSFQLNNALLSRVRVYVLQPLTVAEIIVVLQRALLNLGVDTLRMNEQQLQMIAVYADGDARQALNILEIVADFADEQPLTDDVIERVLATRTRRFDHHGDLFYEQISALHKSVRGSDPDAALYWFARMIDGGCDLHYIARRIVRMASEDIGNADPRALGLAMDAWQAFERLGAPEGELMLAQAVVYCACAAKSNAAYVALQQATQDVQMHGNLEVPLHLRNAPTRLLQALQHGQGYRYAHDEPNAFAAGVCYFPPELSGRQYYYPVERGLEIKIKQKLDYFRQLNREATPGH